jgi:hypothetical protein
MRFFAEAIGVLDALRQRSRLRGLTACGRWVRGAAAGLACGGLAGCATQAERAPDIEPAVVVVENHTEFAWKISFVPAQRAFTEDAADWRTVPARAVKTLELPAGVYRVGRAVAEDAASLAADDAGREGVEMTLEPGGTYTWPLGTLFSTDGVGP